MPLRIEYLPISQLKNQHRWVMIARAEDGQEKHYLLSEILTMEEVRS
jgi:hypothetical protein